MTDNVEFDNIHNSNSLILLRGLPGAGKSTLAKTLSENKWPVFSVDDYFTHPETGDYNFEFDKNHLAYKECAIKTQVAMQNRIEKIFVANTFTIEWELEPYFQLASEYRYQLFVVTVEKRHNGTNIHNVSEEQLKKMADKYKVVLL